MIYRRVTNLFIGHEDIYCQCMIFHYHASIWSISCVAVHPLISNTSQSDPPYARQKSKRAARSVRFKSGLVLVSGNKLTTVVFPCSESEGVPSTAIREISLLKELDHPNVVRWAASRSHPGLLEGIYMVPTGLEKGLNLNAVSKSAWFFNLPWKLSFFLEKCFKITF